MRRYATIFGILLILSIIDFALAAPVLVQEKRRSYVDVVDMPHDVVTVLGKRMEAELENVVLDYFKTPGKPVESPDAHASLSSAPPGLNPESSTANTGLLMEQPRPSTASSVTGVWGDAPEESSGRWSQSYEGDHDLHDVPLDPPVSEVPLKLTQGPFPKLTESSLPSTEFDRDGWMNLLNNPPPRPASLTESDLDSHDSLSTGEFPPANPRLTTKLDSDPNLMAAYPPSSYSPASTEVDKGLDLNPSSPGASSSAEDHSDLHPGSVSYAPSPVAGSSAVPEIEEVPPESPDSIQAARYAAKGKAVDSRSISGTARYVGDAAKRKLQPTERSLDPREYIAFSP